MNKRTQKHAERIVAAVKKIMADFEANIGDLADKSFNDCRVTIEESGKAGRVLLTYDGAGYDFWSCHAEYDVGFRDKLSKALEKIDKHYYFEDCNSWSLSIWFEPR